MAAKRGKDTKENLSRGAVRDMRALLVVVDVAEKIFPHEIPVGLIVGGGQADVFVEVEGRDAAEIEAFLAVHLDQLLIETQGRAAGGEAEHGIGFFADDAGDDFCAEHAADFGIVADKDFHGRVIWPRIAWMTRKKRPQIGG